MTTERKRTVTREQCGTIGGFRRHSKRGEQPCEPCLDANREYRRNAYRARTVTPADQRRPPTPDQRCGSIAGYQAHCRRSEHACARCKRACADAEMVRYRVGGKERRRERVRKQRQAEHTTSPPDATRAPPRAPLWRRLLRKP